MTSWLGDQPDYQVPFRSITLEPPPPSWYRGGTTAFLEDVQRRARMPQTFSILKLERDELDLIFQRSPWIEKVERVEYPPRGVVVHLRYREPVAIVLTIDGTRYLVNGSAVILPHEDIDRTLDEFARQQQLILIDGKGLAGPSHPTPGLTWETKPGVTDLAKGNEKIPASASLARYFRRKMNVAGSTQPLPFRVTHISPIDPDDRGLFIWLNGSICILWGAESGKELEGDPATEEKWRKILEWQRKQGLREIPQHDYWKIDEGGLTYQHGKPWPESARDSRPAQDGEAIRAKGSG